MGRPPRVRTTVPPGNSPARPLVTYDSLVGKPQTLDQAGLSGPLAPPSKGPLTLKATGVPPLTLERNEGTAAVLTMLELSRDGGVIGYLGSDASDRVAIIASDGTTVLAWLDGTGLLDVNHLKAVIDTKSPKYLDATGLQVVGPREAAVANASLTSASGSSASASHASADPVPKADFDGAVDAFNAAISANGAAIGQLATDLNGAIGQLNTLLARLSSAAGHGLIT